DVLPDRGRAAAARSPGLTVATHRVRRSRQRQWAAMAEDFAALPDAEIERRMEEIRARMRPLEVELDRLRGERDQLATELRRRRRLAEMGARRDLKEAMRSGELPTIAELVAVTAEGSFDDYAYNVKTGGAVRLGFPGA